MKRALTIDADVAETGGTLLLEVAMALREHRLRPETMVWSLVGQDKIKLWFVVPPECEHHLSDLMDRFQQAHGVSKVEIDVPPSPSEPPVITD